MTEPQAPIPDAFDGWRVLPRDPKNVRTAFYVDDPKVLFSNRHNRRDWDFDALTALVSRKEEGATAADYNRSIFVVLSETSLDDLDGFDLTDRLAELAYQTGHHISLTIYRTEVYEGPHGLVNTQTNRTIPFTRYSRPSDYSVHLTLFTREFFERFSTSDDLRASWRALYSHMGIFTRSGRCSWDMPRMLEEGLFLYPASNWLTWNTMQLVTRQVGSLSYSVHPVYNVIRLP